MVNGLVRAGGETQLATIPIGTGMDFVRTHGIPTRFEDAVRVARDGVPRTIDVGRVAYRTWDGADVERLLANVGCVGMSAAVAQRANGMSKLAGGKATFFYALVRVFLDWQNTTVTVELADGTRREGLMHDVIVANGQYHGGAMRLAPEAKPDDGLFDVVLIGDITKRDFATTAPKIYRGTYLAHPKVELLRTAAVSASTRPSGCRSSSTASRSGRRRRASRSCRPPCACVSPLRSAALAAASPPRMPRLPGWSRPGRSPDSTSGRSTTRCPARGASARPRRSSSRSCRCSTRTTRTASRSPSRS